MLQYKDLTKSLVGVDINKEGIRKASRSVKNIYYLDISKIDYAIHKFVGKFGQFDTVVMTDVIEHIANLGNCLINIQFLLKDDGELIISTPNIASKFWKSADQIKKSAEHNHEHICWFDIGTLTNLLGRYGFHIKDKYYHGDDDMTLYVAAEKV